MDFVRAYNVSKILMADVSYSLTMKMAWEVAQGYSLSLHSAPILFDS